MDVFGGRQLALSAGISALLLGGCVSHDQVYLANPNPCHISCEYDYVAPIDPICHGYHPTCWKPWCAECAPCPPPCAGETSEFTPLENVPTPVPLPQHLPSPDVTPMPDMVPSALPSVEPENPLRIQAPPTNAPSETESSAVRPIPPVTDHGPRNSSHAVYLPSDQAPAARKAQAFQDPMRPAYQDPKNSQCTSSTWWYN
jgi:hypothetical protein